MEKYQKEFLQFAIDLDVLRFGQFTLKSGRISPYFFNSGLFNTGAALSKLGQFYAQAIVESGIEYDMIYGPAYKGIPLAAAVVIALAEQHNLNIPYAFNRKEAKDHGEGGVLVGAPLIGNILIIDDVISAGTSVRESIDIIEKANAKPVGVVIALDRQELGQDDKTAIQEIELDLQLTVASIVSLGHLIEFIEQEPALAEHLESIKEYRQEYGLH